MAAHILITNNIHSSGDLEVMSPTLHTVVLNAVEVIVRVIEAH